MTDVMHAENSEKDWTNKARKVLLVQITFIPLICPN